jgi:hypothetical protein
MIVIMKDGVPVASVEDKIKAIIWFDDNTERGMFFSTILDGYTTHEVAEVLN